LIEVIASSLLLSTLLAAIVVAHGRHVEQIKKAQQRLAAIRAVDALLVDWFDSPDGVPRNGSGMLLRTGTTVWEWRTRTASRQGGEPFDVQVVQLEVVDPQQPAGARPVVAIEVLVEPSR
jgi:hypothetical protein